MYITSTYRFQCPITIALQHWSGRNAFLIAQSCSAKQADSYVVERPCGVQCLITNTLQHWSEQNAFLIAQSCYAKQADSIAVSHHQCTTALVKTKCLPHCPELLCKTGRQQAVIANRPLGICSSYRCAVTQLQCTAVLIKTKCFPHFPELLCKTG